jgi:hypothetical protein
VSVQAANALLHRGYDIGPTLKTRCGRSQPSLSSRWRVAEMA